MDALNVILGPIISEKSMNDASHGKYTFKVSVKAGKKDIQKAVEEKYKVNAVRIATITIKGRSVKAGAKRTEITRSPFKKAIVTVRAGQKIAIFDTSGVENK
ncbi:MAG: 50S ribosomal protein L23 [Candidatus Levyibacteriota bacterium]|jgi:large subunit ribosomal protein L23